MTFIMMNDSVIETRTCKHCNKTYDFKDIKYADANTPTVLAFTEVRNQMFCPHCQNPHVEFVKAPPAFEKRPTLKGEGRDMLNRIKKRNYGSNMPDY